MPIPIFISLLDWLEHLTKNENSFPMENGQSSKTIQRFIATHKSRSQKGRGFLQVVRIFMKILASFLLCLQQRKFNFQEKLTFKRKLCEKLLRSPRMRERENDSTRNGVSDR
jgi:hypothetical protein